MNGCSYLPSPKYCVAIYHISLFPKPEYYESDHYKKKGKFIAHLSFVFGVWFSVKNTAFVEILALFQAGLLTIGEKGRACENLTAEDRFVNEVQVAERFKGYLLGILRTVYSGLCFLGISPCFRSVACNQHFQV